MFLPASMFWEIFCIVSVFFILLFKSQICNPLSCHVDLLLQTSTLIIICLQLIMINPIDINTLEMFE